jgi:polyisoprenoid-binding protein YceI
MRLLKFFSGLALLVPLLAESAPVPIVVDLAKSEIGFVSHQMGVPVAGTFSRFDAQIQFDPAAPEKGRFLIKVDIASVALPTNDAMREVVKPEWFNTQKFPSAQFESTAVHSKDKHHLEIAGHLDIKGRSQDVTVPVALEQSGATTTATGVITVKRLAFSIGEGDWTDTSTVADEVQIKFRLVMSGIGAL